VRRVTDGVYSFVDALVVPSGRDVLTPSKRTTCGPGGGVSSCPTTSTANPAPPASSRPVKSPGRISTGLPGWCGGGGRPTGRRKKTRPATASPQAWTAMQ
jgi:hypothetical protein